MNARKNSNSQAWLWRHRFAVHGVVLFPCTVLLASDPAAGDNSQGWTCSAGWLTASYCLWKGTRIHGSMYVCIFSRKSISVFLVWSRVSSSMENNVIDNTGSSTSPSQVVFICTVLKTSYLPTRGPKG